jgi:hypothetical protein
VLSGLLVVALTACAPGLINVGTAAVTSGLGVAVASGPNGNAGAGAAVGAGLGYVLGSIVWFFACADPIGGAFTASRSTTPDDKPWYCAQI